MATKLLAPSMGEGVEELTIVNWLKKEGDSVSQFEVVVEVETEKVTTEIPSPVTGTILKILVQNDDHVKVGSTMAWIGKPGEILETTSPAKKGETTEPVSVTAQNDKAVIDKSVSSTVTSSPLVMKLAKENNLDISQMQGTGLNGKVTKEDIEKVINSRNIDKISQHEKSQVTAENKSMNSEIIPHSSIRKQIAERMVNSKHISPHVLTVMEADLSKVIAHQKGNKPIYLEKGLKLTLTAYFCAAIVNALKAFPDVNSSWLEEGIQMHGEINLGIATSLGADGLIVPVIKNAEQQTFEELVRSINDLSSRARSKKLLPEEVRGGTFTLTNHGTAGSLFAFPIIFQPQAAILGTGRMQKRPIVVTDSAGNDAIAIRPMVYLSLVFDHRILDGEGADRFLMKIRETLENWE